MKYLTILPFFIILLSCNSQLKTEKIFENQIKKNLEDNAFKMNCSFKIIELKINRVQSVRIDSLYREVSYARLNELTRYLSNAINAPDFDHSINIKSDLKLNEFIEKSHSVDKNFRGSYVWYYIKGTFIDPNKQETNILYESVLIYFDNNNNILYNNLFFNNKPE